MILSPTISFVFMISWSGTILIIPGFNREFSQRIRTIRDPPLCLFTYRFYRDLTLYSCGRWLRSGLYKSGVFPTDAGA